MTLNDEMVEKILSKWHDNGYKVDYLLARDLGRMMVARKIDHPDATTAAEWFKSAAWNLGLVNN